jgi:TPP-dependent pyruvate/acetoin dehydrogenase alpha subunit
MISVVNGALMARRSRGESGVVGAVSLGDGATSTGAFHEALNQAAIEKLPMVLVVANNRYAYSTPNERQFACRSLVDKAVGYGVRGRACDGVDLVNCLEVVGGAVEAARNGDGPQLVVADLLRLRGHGEHDDAGYVSEELKRSALGRDCLRVAEETAVKEGWLDGAAIEARRRSVCGEVEDAVARVLGEPKPDPFKESWYALASKHLSETHDSI